MLFLIAHLDAPRVGVSVVIRVVLVASDEGEGLWTLRGFSLVGLFSPTLG